jgi:hypothetical protein
MHAPGVKMGTCAPLHAEHHERILTCLHPSPIVSSVRGAITQFNVGELQCGNCCSPLRSFSVLDWLSGRSSRQRQRSRLIAQKNPAAANHLLLRKFRAWPRKPRSRSPIVGPRVQVLVNRGKTECICHERRFHSLIRATETALTKCSIHAY